MICMFSLGILFASGMVLYWDMHTRPFRGLQLELKKHYLGHQISISGGKALKTPGKPEKLRVVLHEIKRLNTEIDLSSVADFVEKIAPEYLPALHYDILEIHLIHPGNATEGTHRSFIKSIKPKA